MPHPLSGIRVVEIGDRIAAAYCGKLLRDAGADVIVVEPEGGSPLRRSGHFFDYLAGGKRSVVATAGQAQRVAAAADIVVLAASPAEARRLGDGHAGLAKDMREGGRVAPQSHEGSGSRPP